MLPTREALLERLAVELPSTAEQPASLLVVGLLRRDDGRPTPAGTLAQVTACVARSVRGDDWLGACGAADFGLVLAGPASATAVAGQRLVTTIAALGIPGLTAAAGISPLEPALSAGEVFRRASLSLAAARRVGAGAGTVISYREPVSSQVGEHVHRPKGPAAAGGSEAVTAGEPLARPRPPDGRRRGARARCAP